VQVPKYRDIQRYRCTEEYRITEVHMYRASGMQMRPDSELAESSYVDT
jgi:hypothetical protein